MSEAIISKIRKLLAVGAASSGATEAEAESAMNMAAALMAKYNIELPPDAPEAGAIKGMPFDGFDESWHIQCGAAAGTLYSCAHTVWRRSGRHSFVGRPDNINACEQTFRFLVNEVERLYKFNLPKGLSKDARAEFRRNFKYACARRLAARAWAIIQELRNSDVKALEATGSRALVVVASIDQQLAEAAEILEKEGVKTMVVRQRMPGFGTQQGRNAGDTVELQRRVG
jgi:hypothetical protein